MDFIRHIIDFVLHIDRHLNNLAAEYGAWTYAILFLIVFCETGLVVTPFLPGDSLLFAAGALAAIPGGVLNVSLLFCVLVAASVIGDHVNYFVGQLLGPKIFRNEKIRFLNPKHLQRTHEFYERYGAKTIVMAKFMPIIRTFAPFVAGLGRMTFLRFTTCDIFAGLLWVSVCLFAGYFFGNLTIVKNNFSLVILMIIVISLMPPVIEFLRQRRAVTPGP